MTFFFWKLADWVISFSQLDTSQWLKILWGIKRTSCVSALRTSEFVGNSFVSKKWIQNLSANRRSKTREKPTYLVKMVIGKRSFAFGREFPEAMLILRRLFDIYMEKNINSHPLPAPAKVYLPFQWDRWCPFPTCGKSIWQKLGWKNGVVYGMFLPGSQCQG